MKKKDNITTRTVIVPGVYRLPTGTYEVWHRGHYVARTDSEADAVAIKEHAKKLVDETSSLGDNIKKARELHKSTKRRRAIRKKVRDIQSSHTNRTRPTTSGRQLLDEQPETFVPEEIVKYLKDHDFEMPQTFEEWSSGSDESKSCSFESFIPLTRRNEADVIKKVISAGELEDSEYANELDVESMVSYAKNIRKEWIDQYINAAVFAIYGWEQDGSRHRDLPLAVKLLKEIEEYYTEDEMADANITG